MRVKVKGKGIPTSFLKIEGRGLFVGAEEWKNRNNEKNWVVIRVQFLKHLLGSKDVSVDDRLPDDR